MDSVVVVVAAVLGAAVGFAAPRWQHLLYREVEFREDRARGRRLLALRALTVPAGAVSAALAARPSLYGDEPVAALATALACLVLIVLSSTDFERRRIPDRLLLPALGLAVSAGWVWPDRSWGEVLAGAGAGLAIAVALIAAGILVGSALRVQAAAFGMGDAKLIVLLGALCGWPAVGSALIVGVIAAGVPSLALILSGRARGVFSYGPYLALGGLLVLLFPGRFVS